jgi:hypothetical protein
MGNDITRSTFDHRKQYVGVVKQQGRVTLDADDNEALDIALDSSRRDNLEIIGVGGSPGDGFHIANPRVEGDSLNFDIPAGSIYVSGIRYLLEENQTYQKQSDWWRNNPQEGRIPMPDPNTDRTDLVYLMLWQQDVSATEDVELLEVALGGIDTTARRKTFGRVLVFLNVQAEDCNVAWERLEAHWEAEKFGTLAETLEVTTDVRLTVTFDPASTSPDLCSPITQGGYLGAANQAIRVQIVDGNHFVWGFDNASALYRVRVRADRRTVDFDTLPRDAFHHPHPGQGVEVLPWSAELANGAKLAALTGHLSTVEVPYNATTKTLTLADPYPDQWPVSDAEGNALTLYLRVWEERLAFTPNAEAPVKLGITGVQVTLTGTQFRAGDYWSMGVRPATPQTVYPERLLTGKAPDGIRYFVCPLALLRWTAGQGISVLDCLEEAFFLDLVQLTKRSKTALNVSSGRVIFENMTGNGEIRASPFINHGLQEEHIAFILALEFDSIRVMGDTAYLHVFNPQESPLYPLMWAWHFTPDRFFIVVQDRRQGVAAPPPPFSFIVRWWAIPKTLEQGDIYAPPPDEEEPIPESSVLVRIAMNPGIGINDLAVELEVQQEALGVLLNRLVEAGRIRIDQGQLFLQ